MKNLIEYDKESILSEEVLKLPLMIWLRLIEKLRRQKAGENIIKLIHWLRTSRILLVNTITWRVERGLHQIPGLLR